MPDIALEIVLDEPDSRYAPGQPVEGEVRVSVTHGDVDRGSLDLSLVWHVRGVVPDDADGTRASSDERVRTERLYDGPWRQGRHVYRFAQAAPRWPYTHHGERVDLRWTLEATVGSPWSADVSVTREIEVRPSPGTRVAVIPRWRGSPDGVEEVEQPASPYPALLAFLGASVVGTVTFAALLVSALLGDGAWLGWTVGVVGSSLSLVLSAAALREAWSGRHERARVAALRAAVGTPQIALQRIGHDDHAAVADEALECTVWVKPGAPVEVVCAALVVRERTWTIVNTGTDDSKDRWIPHVHEPSRVSVELGRSAPGEFRGHLPLPVPSERVPVSLEDARRCHIEWFVEVDVGLEGIAPRKAQLRVRAADLLDEFEEIVA